MAFKDDVISGFGSGLAGSVFGGLSSILGNFFAKKQAERNFQMQKAENEQIFQQNKELAAYQNSLNLAQWNRENAYNSPVAQMARFAAAGLNPDLIYGQQNNAASSPQLIGGTSKQSASAADARNAATNSMASLQNIFAQNSLLHAQAENVKADTENKKADTEQKDIDNKFKADSYAMRLLGIDLGNQSQKQYIDTLKSEANKNNATAQKELKQIEQISAEIVKIDAEIGKIAKECANIDADTQKKILESEELKVLIEKHAAEIYKINAETAYYKEKAITEGAIRSQLYASAKMLMSQADLNSQAYLQNETLFPIKVQQEEKQLDIQDATKRSINATADFTRRQEINYDKYKTWDMVNGSVNAASNFFNAFGNLLKSGNSFIGKIIGKVKKK